jgi:hypothetical protein
MTSVGDRQCNHKAICLFFCLCGLGVGPAIGKALPTSLSPFSMCCARVSVLDERKRDSASQGPVTLNEYCAPPTRWHHGFVGFIVQNRLRRFRAMPCRVWVKHARCSWPCGARFIHACQQCLPCSSRSARITGSKLSSYCKRLTRYLLVFLADRQAELGQKSD